MLKLLPDESGAGSDAGFLHELMSGKEEAAAALFDRYSHFVYAVALRITGNEQTAEEVLHRVFMELWHSRRILSRHRNDQHGLAVWLLVVTRQRAKAICGEPVEASSCSIAASEGAVPCPFSSS
jgi:DNA-directed RNA polymerase specialized sigma24 family protein